MINKITSNRTREIIDCLIACGLFAVAPFAGVVIGGLIQGLM